MSYFTSPSTATAPAPLANLGALDLGIDILMFDLADPGAAARQAVFAYRADAVAPDGKYRYPSQTTFSALDDTDFSALTATIQSAYDMQKSIGVGVSGGGEVDGVQFSGSASYHYAKETTGAFETILFEAASTVRLWRLALNEGATPPLSPAFAKAVADLPPASAGRGDPAYSAFIRAFGTHYAAQATFGGRSYQHSTSSTAQTSTLVQQGIDVSAQAGVALTANVGLSTNTSTSQYKAFSQAVTMEQVQWAGGVASSNWDAWVRSIAGAPVIVGAAFAPLATLLTAANFPQLPAIAQLQANLTAAVAAYLAANGENPAAGAIHHGPYHYGPVASEPYLVFSPLGKESVRLVAKGPSHNTVSIAIASPEPGKTASGFMPICPWDPQSTAPVQTGGGVGLAMAIAPLHGLVFLQAVGGKVDGVMMVNVEPAGAWAFVNPLAPGEGAPVFPGSVVQLKNTASGQYLQAAKDSRPAMTSNALDATTYWVVTTAATP